MVKYKCERCGYENRHRSNFIKHLNRKYICKPKIKDITIEEIKDNVMKCKNKDISFETSKKYAFVIGKEKSLIKVEE